jgi:hypothetical protein
MQMLTQCLRSFGRVWVGKSRRPSTNQFRPEVRELEPRWVPSGNPTIDLSTPNSIGSVNGAFFSQFSGQPTGSGVIQSFLRVHALGVEQGYNTDSRPVQFDEMTSSTFDRSLPLSQVPTVTVGGITYRVFMLDINQKAASPLMSLDELRFYVGGAGNLTGYDSGTHQLAGLTPVYDLDQGSDSWIQLNAGLHQGSGVGDMLAYVPDSLFQGGSFVYLYTKFGLNIPSNSGFEEWSVGASIPFVPPTPAPASISGFASLITLSNQRVSLANVTITLSGTDFLGRPVTMTTMTDMNGAYSFTGLMPGTYILTATQPNPNDVDSANNPGTVNGMPDGMDGGLGSFKIVNIALGAGQNGINYDFIFAQIPGA